MTCMNESPLHLYGDAVRKYCLGLRIFANLSLRISDIYLIDFPASAVCHTCSSPGPSGVRCTAHTLVVVVVVVDFGMRCVWTTSVATALHAE